MNCPSCGANLMHVNDAGETVLRSRGLVLKSDHMALICPKCKGDVPMSQSVTKAVQQRAVLFFKKS